MSDSAAIDMFKEAWKAIDVNLIGQITKQQLIAYMKKNGYDDNFVKKWLRLFDHNNSGSIEVHEFCEVLNINMRELLTDSRPRVTTAVGLPAGVEYISGDMELSWQIKLAQLCLEGLRSNAAMKDVPKWIKTQADRLYNQLWHVVIVSGQFWCYYGHEPGYSFVFRHEKFVFIIWKTPLA